VFYHLGSRASRSAQLGRHTGSGHGARLSREYGDRPRCSVFLRRYPARDVRTCHCCLLATYAVDCERRKVREEALPGVFGPRPKSAAGLQVPKIV
jgi:hypothetical protein